MKIIDLTHLSIPAKDQFKLKINTYQNQFPFSGRFTEERTMSALRIREKCSKIDRSQP